MPTLQTLQITPPQPATMKLQAMGMQDKMKRTGIAEERNTIAREGQALQKDALEFRKMQSNLAMARDFMPTIAPEEMDKVKDHLRRINVPSELVDMLPSTEDSIKMPPDEFKEVTDRLIMGTDNFLKMEIHFLADIFYFSLRAIFFIF